VQNPNTQQTPDKLKLRQQLKAFALQRAPSPETLPNN
jgi:hypothetical protein